MRVSSYGMLPLEAQLLITEFVSPLAGGTGELGVNEPLELTVNEGKLQFVDRHGKKQQMNALVFETFLLFPATFLRTLSEHLYEDSVRVRDIGVVYASRAFMNGEEIVITFS